MDATGNVITNDDEGNTSARVTLANQGGSAITIGSAFTTTAGGTLTLNGDGTYTYTPPVTLPEGVVLTEVFNYTITDADGDTSTSTLTITVNDNDRLPDATAPQSTCEAFSTRGESPQSDNICSRSAAITPGPRRST